MPNLQTPTRSWLFTPGSRPDRFDAAARSGADVSILDLEDAVAPDDKATARGQALAHLAAVRPSGGPGMALRINGLDTRDGLDDLAALLDSEAAPDFLVLPKTDSAGHLEIVDRLLASRGVDTRLVGLIESTAGLEAVEAIASRGNGRLFGLMLGAADMAADLGVANEWEPLVYARSRIVAACARAGIVAIDTPFFDLHDPAGLAAEIARAKAFGFAGKAAIHPGQVDAIRSALTPDDAAIERARRILSENAKGVGMVDGRMIDEAVARQARRILAMAGKSE